MEEPPNNLEMADMDAARFSPVEFSDGEQPEDEDEEVDPRVQGELETLNNASDEINTLERELEKSRNKFRALLADSTQCLNALYKKLGKAVLKARPYYELFKDSKQAQAEAQKAAVNFQRANSVYRAAKEMVQLAEERNFPEDGDRRAFDSAWQEMLNHATMKFMESEKEKAESEENHLVKAAEYSAIQQKIRFFEKDMPRTIKKSRPYFDLKDRLEKQLQNERVNVEDLQMGLVCAKHKYRSALTNLESISEEIHQKRKKRLHLPPRTPGVGAESISDLSSLPSYNLDNFSDTASFASMDDLDADGASLKGEFPDYEKPPDILPGPSDITRLEQKLEAVKVAQPAIEIRESVAEGSESRSQQRDEQRETVTTRTYKSTVTIGPLVNQGPGNYGAADSSNLYHGQGSAGYSDFKAANGGQNMVAMAIPTSETQVKAPSKREQRKIQTQMAFPILQGLTSTQNSLQGAYGQGYGVNINRYPAYPSGKPQARRQSQGTAVAMDEKDVTDQGKKKEEVFV